MILLTVEATPRGYIIKNITGQAKENPMPDYDDTDVLCNEFSDFFYEQDTHNQS